MQYLMNIYVNYLIILTQQNSNLSIIIGDFNLPNYNWKEYTFSSYPKS